MDGPWTQYAPPTPSAPPDGPWMQYAGQKASVTPSSPDMSAMSEFPTYAAPASSEPAPGNAAVERIGKAAADAYRATPSVLSPHAEEAINTTGTPLEQSIGRFITNPALKMVGGAVGTANAGMAALSQAAMEVFGEKGGRDALALLSTLPMVQGERMSPNVATAAETPGRPRFVSERTAPNISGLDPRNAMQKLIEHDINENAYITDSINRGAANQGSEALAAIGKATDIDGAIAAAGKAVQAPVERPLAQWMQPLSKATEEPALTGEILPPEPSTAPQSMADYLKANATPAEAPVPQSVGSAASRDQTPASQIALSTTDMKANRYQAEMKELLSPPAAGDKMIYVDGSLPTLAEYSGDPNLSQKEHLLRERKADAFVGEGKRLTENNNARVTAFETQTPSRTALTMMRDKRDLQWKADTDAILPTAKSVDFTPAVDWVEGQLRDPKIQENDAVRNVLANFRERLLTPDGAPKNNPAAAWGIHDNLQNQLAKAKDPLNATGAEKFAFSELMQAKAHVDTALNVATDNKFQTAIENYAKASQAINAGEELESFRPKLTKSDGTIMADRFHNFVVDLASRRGDPGIDPAMNISDEAMRTLINIDNDLKRAGLIRLGGALGSPTNLLGALAERMGLGVARKMLGKVPVAGPMLEGATDYLDQHQLARDAARHLAPPPEGYVYPNAAP